MGLLIEKACDTDFINLGEYAVTFFLSQNCSRILGRLVSTLLHVPSYFSFPLDETHQVRSRPLIVDHGWLVFFNVTERSSRKFIYCIHWYCVMPGKYGLIPVLLGRSCLRLNHLETATLPTQYTQLG